MSEKKKAALSIILSAAEEYEKNLNGNNLLFLLLDKHKKISYFEVEFNSGNFMHLTGIKLTKKYKDSLKFNAVNNSEIQISYANKFYEKCIDKKIGIDFFYFQVSFCRDFARAEIETVCKYNACYLGQALDSLALAFCGRGFIFCWHFLAKFAKINIISENKYKRRSYFG